MDLSSAPPVVLRDAFFSNFDVTGLVIRKYYFKYNTVIVTIIEYLFMEFVDKPIKLYIFYIDV